MYTRSVQTSKNPANKRAVLKIMQSNFIEMHFGMGVLL